MVAITEAVEGDAGRVGAGVVLRWAGLPQAVGFIFTLQTVKATITQQFIGYTCTFPFFIPAGQHSLITLALCKGNISRETGRTHTQKESDSILPSDEHANVTRHKTLNNTKHYSRTSSGRILFTTSWLVVHAVPAAAPEAPSSFRP
ncbi:hypothetical protein E2C01_014473 [Portunus trituberculatus]|uniref:Uncharacterized protein n=1 Tax=Portunus trituberculatus TaxID=210409 RepID=A0A5B7DK33_PORTR|nr:hypothetical protein [Portunus trituberculatus]